MGFLTGTYFLKTNDQVLLVLETEHKFRSTYNKRKPFRWHPLAKSPIGVAIIPSDVSSENFFLRVTVSFFDPLSDNMSDHLVITALIFDPLSDYVSFHNRCWLCNLSAQSVIGDIQAAKILK